MNVGYINKEVQKMYGIPYSKLTPEQKRILKKDSIRRAKLIKEREEAVLSNNLKAFDDEAKMEKFLASIYENCQKQILADVAETIADVQKDGGTWSYANQSALTRSRGLFDQINEELTKLGREELTTFTSGLEHIYTDQFLREIFTLGQFIPVKANFMRINPALVRQTLNYPWSGAMFSDRLWANKERLGRNLRLGLTQSMILGESLKDITKRINKGIDTEYYNAMRVARTETARVTHVAHVHALTDMEVKRVKYISANDGRVCKVCREDHNKEFDMDKLPMIPRHPNCRCDVLPVVPDTFEPNELNELTGSVRGAENYEKWVNANADKLNPDKSLKAGWERDWKNGGKLVYNGDEPLKDTNKSDKVIKLEIEKRAIQAEIDLKNKELATVAEKYQSEIDDLTAKIADLEQKIPTQLEKYQNLQTERDLTRAERRELRKKSRDGLITEAEYDKQRKALLEKVNKLEEDTLRAETKYYKLHEEAQKHRDRIQAITREIQSEKTDINMALDSLKRKLNDIESEILTRLKYTGRSDAYIETVKTLEKRNVEKRIVKDLDKALTDEEIIGRIAGGDLTQGSCSSLAFTYIGNVCGWDVLDFRDGESRSSFANKFFISGIGKLPGIKMIEHSVKREAGDTAKILKKLDKGKTYYLAVGKHASIIRNTDNGLEYLELQTSGKQEYYQNGWHSFDTYGDIVTTLRKRFGCRKTPVKLRTGKILEKEVTLMEVDSFKGNNEFREILSYINTDPKKQRKGVKGRAK